MQEKTRRGFLTSMGAVTAAGLLVPARGQAEEPVKRLGGPKLKLSLNAYSFNRPLRDGSMNLDDLLDFCARNNFDALDATGYYFPGYPEVPSDDYINHIKLRAFHLGLAISATGIRNDFTLTDPAARQADITLIKNWIICAAKLGAPMIRVFAGKIQPEGENWHQTADRVAEALHECAEFGGKYGVVVAMQNHNDFVKTSDQIIYILDRVQSKWFGLMLDIGSLRVGDPYREIERVTPYAVSWQIKENVYRDGEVEKTDMRKIVRIIRDGNYRGYIPIETLGPGDSYAKVTAFLAEVREALAE
jgi:sugar phosphate isomerase/epimerase